MYITNSGKKEGKLKISGCLREEIYYAFFYYTEFRLAINL
jgi:hypothetical protein